MDEQRAEKEDSSFREDSSFEGLPVVVATRSKKKKGVPE